MDQAVRPLRRTESSFALPRFGGIAAAVTAGLLVLGVVGLAMQPEGLGLRNWLVVLFQSNSGIGSLPADPLRIFNPMDVAILAFVGLAFLGLWPTLGQRHALWTAIAVVLPFAGIVLLLVTGLWGRSAVMGAGLVISVLMLLPPARRGLLGSVGLVANSLLLVGDFANGVFPGGPVATAVAAGYILLLGWYAVLAVELLAGETLRET